MHVIIFLLLLSSAWSLRSEAATQNCEISSRGNGDSIMSDLFECIWTRYVKSYRFYSPGKAANLQGSVSSQKKQPLLQRVRGLSLVDIKKEPKASMALNLLGDYNPVIGRHEVLSSHTLKKESQLLEAVAQTAVVQDTFKTLLKAGVLQPFAITSFKAFKAFLRATWFTRYGGRKSDHFGRRYDRSGFEHVFAGEVSGDGQQVKGLHSWIQVVRLENKGEFDYYGYNYYFSDLSRINLVNVKFGRRKGMKATTVFIGTPLEFDLMLYTTCFLMKHGKGHKDRECFVRLQGRTIVVRTYPVDWKKSLVATAYAYIKK